MRDWKQRLAHDKADRDALVACGNSAPGRTDPRGGFIPVIGLKYNHRVYTNSIHAQGHTTVNYEQCICSKGFGVFNQIAPEPMRDTGDN